MSKVRIAELEYIHKRRLNSVEDMKEWSKQLDLYWNKWGVIRDQLRDTTKDIPVNYPHPKGCEFLVFASSV